MRLGSRTMKLNRDRNDGVRGAGKDTRGELVVIREEGSGKAHVIGEADVCCEFVVLMGPGLRQHFGRLADH
jgi:hypothetical protein